MYSRGHSWSIQVDLGSLFRVGNVEQVLMPESVSQLQGFGVDPECYPVCPNGLNSSLPMEAGGGVYLGDYLFKNGS